MAQRPEALPLVTSEGDIQNHLYKNFHALNCSSVIQAALLNDSTDIVTSFSP